MLFAVQLMSVALALYGVVYAKAAKSRISSRSQRVLFVGGGIVSVLLIAERGMLWLVLAGNSFDSEFTEVRISAFEYSMWVLSGPVIIPGTIFVLWLWAPVQFSLGRASTFVCNAAQSEEDFFSLFGDFTKACERLIRASGDFLAPDTDENVFDERRQGTSMTLNPISGSSAESDYVLELPSAAEKENVMRLTSAVPIAYVEKDSIKVMSRVINAEHSTQGVSEELWPSALAVPLANKWRDVAIRRGQRLLLLFEQQKRRAENSQLFEAGDSSSGGVRGMFREGEGLRSREKLVQALDEAQLVFQAHLALLGEEMDPFYRWVLLLQGKCFRPLR